MNNNPIAVIDSGAGGLATLSSIRKAMPNEDIIYLADTAHMPFGTKSKYEICAYAKSIASYLNSQNVKMIILACGTMSSMAMPTFYECAPMALVQGIIEPAVAATSRACDENSRIGLIATPGSIASGSYRSAFEIIKKHLNVIYKGCPKLASYIEQGITEGPEMEALLKEYLGEMVEECSIDTLVLGCTHYPLVSECIKKIYPQLDLVDPAPVLARSAKSLLKVHELDSDRDTPGNIKLCASRKTESFINMARYLGMGDIEIEEVSLDE